MAFDAFLKITNIPGESTDDKFKDQIEVLSYSHGLSQTASGSVSSGGGRTAERCDHGDFTITHSLDKASPKLALACCNGTHIPEVTLTLSRAGGDKTKYMEYKMTDVIVRSVAPGGSSHSVETLPLEQVSFGYGKIEWTYVPTDHATGKAAGTVAANWDLKTNKGA